MPCGAGIPTKNRTEIYQLTTKIGSADEYGEDIFCKSGSFNLFIKLYGVLKFQQ